MRTKIFVTASIFLTAGNIFWAGVNTRSASQLRKEVDDIKQVRISEFNAALMCASSATAQEIARQVAKHPNAGQVVMTPEDQAWILQRTLELRKEHFPDLPELKAEIQIRKPAKENAKDLL